MTHCPSLWSEITSFHLTQVLWKFTQGETGKGLHIVTPSTAAPIWRCNCKTDGNLCLLLVWFGRYWIRLCPVEQLQRNREGKPSCSWYPFILCFDLYLNERGERSSNVFWVEREPHVVLVYLVLSSQIKGESTLCSSVSLLWRVRSHKCALAVLGESRQESHEFAYLSGV